MRQDNAQVYNIFQSALAIPLAFLVWFVVSTLVNLLLRLFNVLDWSSPPPYVDSLMPILTELFAYGLGAFAAIYAVRRCLLRANLKVVFVVFCTSAFIFFLGLPAIYEMYLLSEGSKFAWGWHVLRFLGCAATVLGAWLAYGQISNE